MAAITETARNFTMPSEFYILGPSPHYFDEKTEENRELLSMFAVTFSNNRKYPDVRQSLGRDSKRFRPQIRQRGITCHLKLPEKLAEELRTGRV